MTTAHAGCPPKPPVVQVAQVRSLAGTIADFIDHYRLERDFSHLLGEEGEDEDEEEGDYKDDDVARSSNTHGEQDVQSDLPIRETDGTDGESVGSSTPGQRRVTASSEWAERHQAYNDRAAEEADLAPEDMPVTIVVKADSANTLASVLDALGDWGDVESLEQRRNYDLPEEQPGVKARASTGNTDRSEGDGNVEGAGYTGPEWGEHDLQHKQRRRLVVSVARSGVGAVTSSDVCLARDCECPVFAHNVKADASAARELKRVGGGVVPALPESAVAAGDERVDVGVGGLEGFIGRAGEGRECVVVSETVGELLGEIERFVLRVR